jgi:hypothetical protein
LNFSGCDSSGLGVEAGVAQTKLPHWLGGLLLFGVVLWFRPLFKQYGLVEAPTSLIGIIAFSFVTAVACVVLSFIVIVCWRFLIAPSRLYSALRVSASER